MGHSKTRSLAIAFTLFQLTYAFQRHSSDLFERHSRLLKRQNGLTIPNPLPTPWTALGCITDNGSVRSLAGAADTADIMTIENCLSFCSSFIFAGVEYGRECYCADTITPGTTNATATDCDMPCAANANEPCGAGDRINLFWNGTTPPPAPAIKPSVGSWVSLGCYTDNVNNSGRALTFGATTDLNTIESCTTACFNAGFGLAGAEYSTQCYCGSGIVNGGGPADATDCDMTCAGDGTEFCGGPNRLNVYNFTGTGLPPQGGGGGGDVGEGPATVVPVLSGLPIGWAYNACWIDNVNGRIFTTTIAGNPNNTVEICIATCAEQNFTVAGTEYADECYCGDTLVSGAVTTVDSDCDMGCAGNTSEACGGPNRVSVYSSVPVVALPVPVAMTTDLPGKWTYAGCLREPATGKMFPNEIIWIGNNSALACMNQCAAFGYPASGVEYGQECYCGDITDVAANDGILGAESECATPCPGDPVYLCGDGNRLNTYFWNGTMNNWQTPKNTGFYEFFVPGVVVPLIATVGLNNKVTFLEKDGTGLPNSTGAYELDLTLVDQFDLAWREMHVKTDVFCSGSIVLPDIAGRLINVGGWSLESTFGLRLYTPDGSPGVNGTNDWEENWKILSLQRGRWYPTAAMLPNGSILVIGGETGSNASPQPNLEVLPKPAGGDTVVYLDFLDRTDPYNLYPFVIVLPSNNLFVGYYNEARILEPVTFTTITQLPNIPGAVNDFLAGRTYPLEGSAVPLPQFAPYTDPLEILICGGSTIGAGFALDNCVTIAPEAPNATWTLERMPSKRVMPCIASLPDGTFLILNGALQGVAGFGLASDPNLGAVLYDPTQPIGSRMSILNNTIVARLYHSEATLLPDGRVLVSGSDPQTDFPNGTVEYPEEFRIEVYVPPYLTQGFTQPTFTIPVTDWAYGGQYQITNVNLVQSSGLRVSLVAATSSTHGNAMGARTIFPAFTCSGATCTITAPPNTGVSPPGWHQLFILDGPTPSVSQWVRIGGDPSELGNWPDLPGFTTPGL